MKLKRRRLSILAAAVAAVAFLSFGNSRAKAGGPKILKRSLWLWQ